MHLFYFCTPDQRSYGFQSEDTRAMNPHNSKSENFVQKQTLGLIICGPCACGKSEVASALAAHFKVPFVDADSLHSESNIKKMSVGIPLTDEDRFPWLMQVRKELIKKRNKDEKPLLEPSVAIIGACSALKKSYRDILAGVNKEQLIGESNNAEENSGLSIIFVFLNCSEAVLQTRLNSRQGHFMKANMLSSQLTALELPQESTEGNRAIVVNGDKDLRHVISETVEKLDKLCKKYSKV